MNWYYVEEGQRAGPVDDAAVAALAISGKISADTLVWHEGMAQWQRWAEVKPEHLAALASVGAPPVLSSPSLPLDPSLCACVECGRVMPRNEMISFAGSHVCAACKPVFMQKLAEGAQLKRTQMAYAGFWIRFGAKFVDWTILGIVFMGPAMIFAALAGVEGPEGEFTVYTGLQLLFQGLYFVASIIYDIFFIGKYGATPGKMLCRLRVVTAEGGKVSYARATGRHFAEMLSRLVCYIGYIIAAFDDERRSLHDHICNTRVITQ